MNIKNITELNEHILNVYPQEGCGIIVNEEFIPLPNESPTPADSFKISDEIYFNYKHTIQAVIHSHTMDKVFLDGRAPSMDDMEHSQAAEIPYGIVHCDGETVSPLVWINSDEIAPLEKRPYIPNVYDCYTLVRDYYRLHYGLDFGLHPRPPKWEDWDISYMQQQTNREDFKTLGIQDHLQKGDILYFRVGSRYPTHMGVVISDTSFLHHLFNKKSSQDSLERWKKQIVSAYRYLGDSNVT